MEIRRSLQDLPSYPFGLVRKKITEVEQKTGKNVIRCYIGVPDTGLLQSMHERYVKLAEDHDFKNYPIDRYGQGIEEVREAVAEWYNNKFPGSNISADNILITNWTKEILHNVARIVKQGTALIPDPVYPAYVAAAILAGHDVKFIEASEKNGWLPSFDINGNVSIFYFCDPNNPTGAVADKCFYNTLNDLISSSFNGIGVFDGAYVDLVWDGSTVYSPMQFGNLSNTSVHIISLSKSYNTVADGIGIVIAQKDVLEPLLKLHECYSQGVPAHKQLLLREALTNPEIQKEARKYRQELRDRIQLFTKGLRKLGFEVNKPKATPYLWIKTPWEDDKRFVFELIERCGVAFMFGSAFGQAGAGYMRATVYLSEEKIKEALERLESNIFW